MIWHLSLALAARACFPVEGDRILMGDLAAADPGFASADPRQNIGFAPAPGAQRRFAAGEMHRLAIRYGIAGEPEPVCFERKLEALTRERVLAALRQSLPEGCEPELIDFSHVRVPEGSLEFPPRGLAPPSQASPREPVLWRGRVKYGSTQSVPVWAKTRVWISRAAVVAVRDLPVGKPIGADQIRVDNLDGGPFTDSEPARLDQLVGLAPRRPIRAGQVVPRSALEASAEVARGETVGIEARYGAALLKSEVRAEAQGRVGDQIPVRNLESGKTFRARVIRKGWVAVE